MKELLKTSWRNTPNIIRFCLIWGFIGQTINFALEIVSLKDYIMAILATILAVTTIIAINWYAKRTFTEEEYKEIFNLKGEKNNE